MMFNAQKRAHVVWLEPSQRMPGLPMKLYQTLVVLAGLSLWSACNGSSDVACGDGTALHNGRCTIADAGPGRDTPDGAVADAGDNTPVKCGDGTVADHGECVPSDAGAAAQAKPVGAPCMDAKDCQTGTCAPSADNLPGGYCTVLNCNMDRPCPVGSTCYALNKSLSLCMAYCDRDTQCRSDENYHCQPLYTTAVNICAPSCELTQSCSAGTRCNPDSGLCELSECDVKSPGNACTDQETCTADSKGLSSKGGLCLHLCKPSAPEKSCNVDQNEVCQPLANDPANSGFCAPPVCSKTSECPAGAECKNSVCQPPALCDGNQHCKDDATTCVSGKCMPKCPTDSKHCSDVHPDLVCADVLSVPACLPLASYPGSACRSGASNRCDSLKVGDSSAAMVCENNTCLVDCTAGGQPLCSGLSDTLECAHGVFPTDLCLPKGSYPGSACGTNNACAQDLNGDPAVDMSCVAGTCVIGCSETDKWSGYGDALCSLVDPSLTCATAAGSICVRTCSSEAGCDSGFSCLDPGNVASHQNACLPNGTFPGSACRPSSGDACDRDLGGNSAVDMVCSNNTCVVSCPNNNDALCSGVDPRLTCSESAGNVCLLSCASGSCATGFACLDPGGVGHQNACLPTGSFPGSPCRDTTDNKCDQNVGGNDAVDLVCASNTCTVSCPSNNDGLCAAVDPRLTCAESAGNLCVFGCVSGACPTGFSCLDPGDSSHQNACLPTGSFPSSPCRTGNQCDPTLAGNADVTLTCLGGACVVQCPNNLDALCQTVDPRLTCAESAGNVCVFSCVAGACPSGYSCLDPGDSTHQNACLPTGTFPSSPCRSAQGNQCDQNLGGNDAVDLVCVQNTCAVSCPSNNDVLCGAVDPRLTCSESAGNLCVFKCVSGACPSGFSCLDPGGSPHQNACLPLGSFPGSPCRTTSGDQCDQNLGGNVNVDMQCVQNTCVVSCPNNNDALCMGVNSGLTCAVLAGNVCVPACVSGACPTGFSCFVAENACFPAN
jgi:hypothetical protein